MEEALQRYAALLLSWNRRINLSSARTLAEVREHIQDARSLLDLDWDAVTTVIDIGSGGGLPAVPLALALPGTHFSLLEANARKGAFLEHVAGSLHLKNVAVLIGRAETLGHDRRLRERFDRAISRAAARPPVLLELALPFVRTGGDLVAEVGEIDALALEPACRLLGGASPRLERRAGGNLLVVPKITLTPPAYPRRPGWPNRRPLA